MKTLLQLAIRNIGRNRRRSILAFISVALSLMLIVFMQGWIGGIMQSVVKNYTKNETGHIRIATVKFEEKSKFQPVTENINDPQSIINRIKNAPDVSKDVELVTPRIMFGVLLSNNGKNKTVLAFSGDPQNEKQLLMLQESLLPGGRYIQHARETIVGWKLAERLGYKIGDTLKIVANGSDYALRMKKAVIVGIYKTGINLLDENVFQIPLASAQELLGMDNQVQQILVMVKDWRKSDQIAQKLRSVIPDSTIAVTSWTKIGDYYRLVKTMETIYTFIYFVVAFLGAFIISNIMMMVVMERRKEIGILKSMGMTRRDILILFLLEGSMLGFTGSVIGTLLGWMIVLILGHTGIDLTSILEAIKMPLDNVIYPRISLLSIIGSLVLGTLIAALVSLLPSRQAARMNVVEAIKSV